MRFSLLLPVVAAAAFGFSTSAGAITVVEDSGNLDFFSAVVDMGARTITINETWGVNTAGFVDIKITDFPIGLSQRWTVIKNVTNNTGVDFNIFQHELLNSDKSASDNKDGLSFGQNIDPIVPRVSDSFNSVLVDELEGRDFLLFFDGMIANGSTGSFQYGLSVSRAMDNNPFYIRQLGVVPEPATWAMLITGFGLVGFAMRRRKSAIASVAA